MALKVRCLHLAVAGLFLWSLGAAGICEALCLQLAPGVATPGQSDVGPSPGQHEPSCHGGTPAQREQRAASLDPAASGGEPACHCVHADDALVQQRADSGRPGIVLPALALAPCAEFGGAVVRWRHIDPRASVMLAPHRYWNPPLLI